MTMLSVEKAFFNGVFLFLKSPGSLSIFSSINFIAPDHADIFEEGFVVDSSFVWKVWDASSGIVWPMEVSYNPNFSSDGWFEGNGQSGLLSMNNLNPITVQQIDLPLGWSMFSSHIIVEDMDIVSLIEPISDDVIIVKNGEGAAYLVEYQFNAIGDLEVGQGYIVKTTQACNISVEGVFAKGELYPISLESGWNMVGYLREESESVEIVFKCAQKRFNFLCESSKVAGAFNFNAPR